MKRLAWAVLLSAACTSEKREQPQQQKRLHVEEVDRLPDDKPAKADQPTKPAVAPKQRTPSLDQVLECFSEPIITPVPETISSVTTGDFDGDGRIDVVLTYETLADQVFTGHVVTYRNLGDGKFVEAATIEAGSMVYAVSSGDIDNDGKLDLAVGDPRGGKTRLYRGNGDGSFTEKPGVASRKPYGAKLVDLDKDGKLDMVVELFSDIQVYRGDGKFGFKRTASVDTGQAPDGPVAADLDGDGTIDLGYAANDEGYWFVLEGPKWKQTAKGEATCGDPGYTSGADFDDDGDVDMGWVCEDKIEVRLNDGKGGFKPVTYPYGPSEHPIIHGDLTGDGKTDLLTSHRVRTNDPFDISAKLVLLEGVGGGEWREHSSGKLPIVNDAQVADVDGDKRLDIVLGTWTGNKAAITVLLAQDCRNAP